jgi:hypothetical protein
MPPIPSGIDETSWARTAAAASTASTRLNDAVATLASLPPADAILWTDGSAVEGITSGGSGAMIESPSGCFETIEWKAAAGAVCGSYRAELTAVDGALKRLLELPTEARERVSEVSIC